MSHYQDWVLKGYETSRAKHLISIDDYVNHVVHNMASVKHKDEIYEPITFQVLVRGFDEAVPVQTDFSEGWYERLQSGVAEMIGGGGAGKNLEFRDMTGENIADRNANELSSVGKIRIFDKTTGKRIQTEPGPQVPGHMSNNKMHRISEWFEDKLRENAIHTIASELKGSTATVDLQTRTQINSSLEKKLCDLLSSDLQGHLKRHGSNERAKQSDATVVAQQMARTMMKSVRSELRGQMQRIKKHMAAKAVTAMSSNIAAADEEEPLFDAAATQGIAVGLQNESQLYGKIARRAIIKSKMDLINHIYHASTVDCGCGDEKKKNKKDDDDYYADYYYGNDVYQKYQLYSGRAVHMEIQMDDPVSHATAVAAAAAESAPTSALRGARLRKKLHQQQEVAAKFVPFEKKHELDELVPIRNSMTQQRTPDKKNDMNLDLLDDLVPIKSSAAAEASNLDLDELVPIRRNRVSAVAADIASDLPDFYPKVIPTRKPNLILADAPAAAAAPKKPGVKLVHISELMDVDTRKKNTVKEPKKRIEKDSDRINDGMPDIYDFM
jgi:hypothetical protein